MSTMVSPKALRSSDSATCTTPSGSQAPDPTASFSSGIPNRTMPGIPSDASRFASTTQRRRRVLEVPRQRRDGDGVGHARPARTAGPRGRRHRGSSRPPGAAAPGCGAAGASAAPGMPAPPTGGRGASSLHGARAYAEGDTAAPRCAARAATSPSTLCSAATTSTANPARRGRLGGHRPDARHHGWRTPTRPASSA